MYKLNIISTNKEKVSIIVFSIITLIIGIKAIYMLALHLISESLLGRWLLENINYLFFGVFLVTIYFIITGVYYYRVKIDPYVIDITSYSIVFSSIKSRKFIDISHAMLVGYFFLIDNFLLIKH